jgi:hypothetical protein
MFTCKKSFLAIFMVITLGTGFIMQAEPAQDQNTEQKDQFAGQSAQVQFDSDPGAWITQAVRERDEKAERERNNKRIGKMIQVAVIFGSPLLYHAVRYGMVGPDQPYADWEKWLAGFWCLLSCAELI